MLRVAHLNAGNLYGGIESFLVTLANIAAGRGELEQRFVLTHQGRFSEELSRAGAGVETVGPARLSRPWSVTAARKRATAALRRFRPDVVIAHDIWPLVVLGPSASGFPLLYYQHMAAKGTLLERLASHVKIQGILSNSYFSAGTAKRLFPEVPVSIVRPPVRPPVPIDRLLVRRALGVKSEELVIIQVSRFERWKGHMLHLDALKLVRSERPWRLWIVGGASRKSELELRADIEHAIAELPPGNVSLLGERRDVPTLMQAADIFCQPNSGPEPFGLVFVEALSAGLPVVTTRMGGAVEIVDESVGILTDPNAAAVAEALQSLLNDDDLRTRLAAGGPARAQQLCGPEPAFASLIAALGGAGDRPEQGKQKWG